MEQFFNLGINFEIERFMCDRTLHSKKDTVYLFGEACPTFWGGKPRQTCRGMN